MYSKKFTFTVETYTSSICMYVCITLVYQKDIYLETVGLLRIEVLSKF